MALLVYNWLGNTKKASCWWEVVLWSSRKKSFAPIVDAIQIPDFLLAVSAAILSPLTKMKERQTREVYSGYVRLHWNQRLWSPEKGFVEQTCRPGKTSQLFLTSNPFLKRLFLSDNRRNGKLWFCRDNTSFWATKAEWHQAFYPLKIFLEKHAAGQIFMEIMQETQAGLKTG